MGILRLNVQRGIIVIMSRSRLKNTVVYLAVAASMFACASPGQIGVNTPQGRQLAYPPVIEDSPQRRQAAEDAWRKFIAEFRLPDTPPDLEPVLNTPRTMPSTLAGQIMLHTRAGAFGEIEAREALRRFIERARDVIIGDQVGGSLGMNDLSLVSFTNDGSFYRGTYRQMNYSAPIANGYGELHLAVGKNGMLLQWGSRLIPLFELPARAEITRQSIAEKLVGREFKYSNVAGMPMSYQVSDRSEISVKELVVYPKQEGSRISIHLAYPVEAGRGTTWTIYVDAINGQEIDVKQNFQT
jgi:hypothetical protein